MSKQTKVLKGKSATVDSNDAPQDDAIPKIQTSQSKANDLNAKNASFAKVDQASPNDVNLLIGS